MTYARSASMTPSSIASGTARVALAAIAAWIVMAIAAILNGAFREAVLAPTLGEGVASVVSITILVTMILGVSAWMVARRWNALRHRTLLVVGASWAVGSALFEFALGRIVLDVPWSELLAAYDVLAGRPWILAPLAMLIGPSLAKLWLRRGDR